MNVKELIEILKNLPPDAEVRIYKDVASPMAFESHYKMAGLTIQDVDDLNPNIVNLG